jgi:hypothetical protein
MSFCVWMCSGSTRLAGIMIIPWEIDPDIELDCWACALDSEALAFMTAVAGRDFVETAAAGHA